MPRAKRPSRGSRKGGSPGRVGRSPAGSGAGGPAASARRRGVFATGAARLTEHPREIAGLVVRRGKHQEVESLFQGGPPLLLTREGPQCRAGDLVLYVYSHGRRAKITRIIGQKGDLKAVLNALILDDLVQRGFGPRVLAEAAEAASLEKVRDSYRADLRDLFTFTVDPATARDFDDALSFEQSDGLVRVYVHIADVSYYVIEDTALDQEALRRGNSVYVPTDVEPMLPEILSSGVCSLSPGVDRKAVTVEMDLGPGGEVRATRFYRSVIRSDMSITYDELEDMFRGGTQPPTETLARALDLGRPLAATIRENRFRQGSLRITSIEPDFHWDDEGGVASAHPAEEFESHQFIEEYMVLANRQVAGFLERQHTPTVYRVHDLPDPFHLDHLLDVLASLDLPTPVFDPMLATPQEIRRVTRETAEWVDRFTPKGKGKQGLVQQVLRTQSRAVYQVENIGHFGLAIPTYCHFTSPIRRYPDLLVHRHLLAELGLGPDPTTTTLADWAEHCSRMEREAAKVELTADDIALAYLLKGRLDQEGWETVFSGQIIGLLGSGAFVLFESLYQGFLPARDLPGDYFRLNEMETALVGTRTGETYRLADTLPITVVEIDEPRGRIRVALARD